MTQSPPKGPPPNAITLGSRFQHMNFGGTPSLAEVESVIPSKPSGLRASHLNYYKCVALVSPLIENQFYAPGAFSLPRGHFSFLPLLSLDFLVSSPPSIQLTSIGRGLAVERRSVGKMLCGRLSCMLSTFILTEE